MSTVSPALMYICYDSQYSWMAWFKCIKLKPYSYLHLNWFLQIICSLLVCWAGLVSGLICANAENIKTMLMSWLTSTASAFHSYNGPDGQLKNDAKLMQQNQTYPVFLSYRNLAPTSSTMQLHCGVFSQNHRLHIKMVNVPPVHSTVEKQSQNIPDTTTLALVISFGGRVCAVVIRKWSSSMKFPPTHVQHNHKQCHLSWAYWLTQLSVMTSRPLLIASIN